MSLTGTPVIILAILGTVAALAATHRLWMRGQRRRLPTRTVGVLLTEALLLLSVGLVVNRSEQFYPTWSALLQTGRSAGTTYATAPGDLDHWLRGQAGARPGQSTAFTWQPVGWAGWRLAGPPTVVTPVGYLEHPTWRYSALLTIDDGVGGWTPATEAAAARTAGVAGGAAVMVFARTTATTTANTLVAALPAALARDLRVTGRRWALVTSTADTRLAGQAVAAAPARYPAVAFVPVPVPGSGPGPGHGPGPVQPARPAAGLPARTSTVRLRAPAATGPRPARPVGDGAPPPLPDGIAVAVVGAPARTVAPVASTTAPGAPEPAIRPVYLAARAGTALGVALTWACRQTPPPLAASTPAVTFVPIHHRASHHGAHPSPSGSQTSGRGVPVTKHPGGSHAPGQPRR